MKQKILAATNNGLDVLLYYFPQAREVVEGRAKMFKMREQERTASASIKLLNGSWVVTDFGDSGTAKSCFDVVMEREGVNFSQALWLLADRYHVESVQLSKTLNRAERSERMAKDDEKDGDFSYKKRKVTESELSVWGPFVTPETMERYHYYALASYTMVKVQEDGRRMAITYSSTEHYPIFLRECDGFQKIYKPLEYNKAYRFFYKGTKAANYINGLEELEIAYAKLQQNERWKDGSHVDEEAKEKPKKKLSAAIFCSGERDALNVAGMGYYPLWLNSETAKLQEEQLHHILEMVERVYNIPDIDETGVRMGRQFALRYPEVYTVELPVWLRGYKDNRGRARKDLRDYLELRPYPREFKQLLQTAPRCKFWYVQVMERSSRTNINTAHLLWFLVCNGFARIEDKVSHQDRYVRLDGYKVREYTPKQIRAFVKQDLEKRMADTDVINLFLNSKRTSANLADDLPVIQLDFTRSTATSRTLFFENKSVVVTKDAIEELQGGDGGYVWEESISPHCFRRTESSFAAEMDGEVVRSFRVTNARSRYFRVLINASRLYWRNELEARSGEVLDDMSYAERYKWSIDGPRLTDIEKEEQVRNLVNKLYSLGYLLHRYKSASNAMAVWIMENKLTEEDESSGGSGKSFMTKALKQLGLSNIVTLQGRDKKITENKHLMDRVSSNTDILLWDDVARYADFDYFYTMITGEMTVNPKGSQSFEIDYADSPMMVINSNFPPPNNDGSTMRRILPVVFSDYYHQQTARNDYRETRSIYDDFGMDLFGDRYTPELYNDDLNFLVDCLQFYLQMQAKHVVLRPNMENVYRRINISTMGNMFKDWAEGYFSIESDNLNWMIPKKRVFDDFVTSTGARQWTTQKFTKALTAFVENCEWLEGMNPKELCNAQGRIIRRLRAGTTAYSAECIYLQQLGEPVRNMVKEW